MGDVVHVTRFHAELGNHHLFKGDGWYHSCPQYGRLLIFGPYLSQERAQKDYDKDKVQLRKEWDEAMSVSLE